MTPQYWRRASPVLLTFLYCSGWLVLLGSPRLAAETDAGQAVNLAVVIEGQVNVKRKGWTNYAPVVFGTPLRRGDLLRLDGSSRAKVVCSDLTLHDLSPGIVGVPCESDLPILRTPGGSLINATRGWPSDGSLPMVLSPRKTKLLSSHPLLRWTAAPGTHAYLVSYLVIVRGLDLNWSTEVFSATEFAYPVSAPPLKVGVDYKLIVETGEGSSSAEPGLGSGFSVLGPNDRNTVLKEQRRIEDLGLPAGPTQFLIAHLYASHDLNAEAIKRLESISETFKVSAVARLLGDLYLKIGLLRQAETSYLNSLDLSKDEKDEEGQMLVHLALARIYAQALGNVKLANEQLDAALAMANRLGDDYTSNEVGKRLAGLKRMGT
jgi:hypothetical protein